MLSATSAEILNLPSLEFLLGDYWVQVRPSDYMILPTGSTSYQGCFVSQTSDIFVLGTAFLKGYYSVFKYGNASTDPEFGFAPQAEDESPKPVLEENDVLAEHEALPTSEDTVLDYKSYFEGPEDSAADSAYYLNSALVISSLLTLALF